MAARVEEHIANRIPDLPRRPQHVDVAAIDEHTAGAVKDAVHAARKACGDRLEPARQITRTACLDDHVDVVSLNRIVNEPKSAALADFAPAAFQLDHEIPGPELRNVLLHLQRDVTRMTRRQR
jgi:hypothetical protein